MEGGENKMRDGEKDINLATERDILVVLNIEDLCLVLHGYVTAVCVSDTQGSERESSTGPSPSLLPSFSPSLHLSLSSPQKHTSLSQNRHPVVPPICFNETLHSSVFIDLE